MVEDPGLGEDLLVTTDRRGDRGRLRRRGRLAALCNSRPLGALRDMSWQPIRRERLASLLRRDLAECSDGERAAFDEYRSRWQSGSSLLGAMLERCHPPFAVWTLLPWRGSLLAPGDDGAEPSFCTG